MPKLATPLTDIQPRTAKPKAKPYKLSDGAGLYLLINTDGAKYWHMDYRFCEARRTLAFGKYPDVTLAEARDKRMAARKLLDQGIDPSQEKKERQRERNEVNANTFEKLAREWHANKLPTWSVATARDTIRRLEIDIFPQIGSMPIGAIKHQHMIAPLRKIESRGAHEIAHRIKATCARVFSYANQQGIENRNPAADMKDVLKPVKAGHFAAITADELPAFLAAMGKNDARLFKPTRITLRLMMLVFVRTSELIETPWSEIDLEAGQWIIPWHRMKRGKLTVNPDTTDHHVCLSSQALDLLRELHMLTGGGKYLFPNQRDHEKPMSNGAILMALKRMDYQNRKRLVAFVMAEVLVERGIPPSFWHEELALDSTTVNQRADLLLFDLAWLRRWHRDHASAVRYLRGKASLTGSDAVFHREAAFAFHQGKRPAWKIVGSLSLTDLQQWDAAYLRSEPIKKQAEVTSGYSKRVRQALLEDLRKTRRTATFGEAEARSPFSRRHALWCCSRMVKDASPTEIAARYYQMTGMQISRQAVANQLAKVRAVLRERGDDFMA